MYLKSLVSLSVLLFASVTFARKPEFYNHFLNEISIFYWKMCRGPKKLNYSLHAILYSCLQKSENSYNFWNNISRDYQPYPRWHTQNLSTILFCLWKSFFTMYFFHLFYDSEPSNRNQEALELHERSEGSHVFITFGASVSLSNRLFRQIFSQKPTTSSAFSGRFSEKENLSYFVAVIPR